MLLEAKIGSDPFVFLVLWQPFTKNWANQVDRNTDFLRNISRIELTFLLVNNFGLHVLNLFVVPEKLFWRYYKVRWNNFRLNTFFISRSKRNTGKTMFYKQTFQKMVSLTHLSPIYSFSTSWKHQKTASWSRNELSKYLVLCKTIMQNSCFNFYTDELLLCNFMLRNYRSIPTNTYLFKKLTLETLDKVWNMFKANRRNTRMTSMTSFWYFCF